MESFKTLQGVTEANIIEEHCNTHTQANHIVMTLLENHFNLLRNIDSQNVVNLNCK